MANTQKLTGAHIAVGLTLNPISNGRGGGGGGEVAPLRVFAEYLRKGLIEHDF